MKIAIHGLGRMGMQIARKLAEGGHTTIALNRTSAKTDEAATYGATAAYSKQEVLDAFGSDPVVIWIMLPADVTESELQEWASVVPKGSTLIDGGNSDFRHTRQHAELLKDKDVRF